jgi:uncharacterized protein YndB with AHSA1/START domain
MTTTTPSLRVFVVYIRATPDAVWDAITKPEWTAKYGYGAKSEYDLRPGGTFVGHASDEMTAMDAPDVVVDGEVIEADRPRRLVQTWRLLMEPTLAAEGCKRLTYEFEERDPGVTKLTVSHDLEGAPQTETLVSGGLEAQGAGGGWSWVLSDLKSLLETGNRLAG